MVRVVARPEAMVPGRLYGGVWALERKLLLCSYLMARKLSIVVLSLLVAGAVLFLAHCAGLVIKNSGACYACVYVQLPLIYLQ